MFGIRFGAQGVALHATSSGKLPSARSAAKCLHTGPGMPLSPSFAEKDRGIVRPFFILDHETTPAR